MFPLSTLEEENAGLVLLSFETIFQTAVERIIAGVDGPQLNRTVVSLFVIISVASIITGTDLAGLHD